MLLMSPCFSLTGLDQPGFLHGSNFLLPYDVIITVDRDKWPVLGESKKGKTRKIHKGKERHAKYTKVK